MPQRRPLTFFSVLNNQRLWLVLWVYYLVTLNLSSAVFWPDTLAIVIFFTFILSATSIIALYSVYGFEKIMGLGHIYWIPLLIYLLTKIADTGGYYQAYLVLLSVSIIVSLGFDIVDVWTFISRKRTT